MNQRHRHLRYKKNVYARRRLRVILWTSVAVAAVLLLLFLVIGNLLHGKVEEDRREDADRNDAVQTTPADTLKRPPAIAGVPVYLVKEDGSPLSSLNSQYSSLDPASKALTVPLDKGGSTLLYPSAVAASLGTRPVLSGAASLESMLRGPNERGFYISVSLTLSECAEEDDLIRSAKMAAAASLVCEALRAGAGDVLLMAPEAKPEQLGELIALADRVRALMPEAVVGLSISDAILDAPSRDGDLEALAGAFHYLALDLTDPDGEEPVSYVASRVSGMLFYLLRYQMRVILPPTEGEDYQSLLSILDRNSVHSWQDGYQ